MKGTIINVVAIVVGTGLGVTLKRGIPERFKSTVIQGLSLAIIVIGLQMALQTENVLIVVLSLVFGALTGELLKIEDMLTLMGTKIEKRLGGNGGSFTKAFVTASLVYCVGAMAIVGSIQDGISGDATTLYAKSLLDGVASVVFASTLGIGVAFSAIPVFLYQGLITVLAQYLQGFLTSDVIKEITATGGVLIIGIGIKMIEIKEIKVGNLLPSVFYALVLSLAFQGAG